MPVTVLIVDDSKLARIVAGKALTGASLGGFDAGLARARDALARVEKRVERLEQKIGARTGSGPRGAH